MRTAWRAAALLAVVVAGAVGIVLAPGARAVDASTATCRWRWSQVDTRALERGAAPPDALTLADVATAPTGEVFVVGTRAVGRRWDAGAQPIVARLVKGRWEVDAVPAIPHLYGLTGVAVRTRRDGVVVGSTFEPRKDEPSEPEHGVALRWDGHRWRAIPVPRAAGALVSVAITARGTVWVVGDGVWTLVGRRWTRVALPASVDSASAVAAFGPDVWITADAGGEARVLRRAGRTWSVLRPPAPRATAAGAGGAPDVSLSAIAAFSGGRAAVVGRAEWPDAANPFAVTTSIARREAGHWALAPLAASPGAIPMLEDVAATADGWTIAVGQTTYLSGPGLEFASWEPLAAVETGSGALTTLVPPVRYRARPRDAQGADLASVALSRTGTAYLAGSEHVQDGLRADPYVRPLLLSGRCASG